MRAPCNGVSTGSQKAIWPQKLQGESGKEDKGEEMLKT